MATEIYTLNGTEYTTRVYRQCNGYYTYSLSGLTDEQIQDLYLTLCSRFRTVDLCGDVHAFNGTCYGYFACK